MNLSARDLVQLPWAWIGPIECLDEHGNKWWQLTIRDLPDFLAAAETRDEVLADAPEALESFLASFEGTSEWPPMPAAVGAELAAFVAASIDQRDRPAPAASPSMIDRHRQPKNVRVSLSTAASGRRCCFRYLARS